MNISYIKKDVSLYFQNWMSWAKIAVISLIIFSFSAGDYSLQAAGRTPVYYFFLSGYSINIAQGFICLISGFGINDKYLLDENSGFLNYLLMREERKNYFNNLLMSSTIKLFITGFLGFILYILILSIKFSFRSEIIDDQLVNSLFAGRLISKRPIVVFYIIYSYMVGCLPVFMNIICLALSFFIREKTIVRFLPYILYSVIFNTITSYSRIFDIFNPSRVFSGHSLVRTLLQNIIGREIPIITESLFPLFMVCMAVLFYYLCCFIKNNISRTASFKGV